MNYQDFLCVECTSSKDLSEVTKNMKVCSQPGLGRSRLTLPFTISKLLPLTLCFFIQTTFFSAILQYTKITFFLFTSQHDES